MSTQMARCRRPPGSPTTAMSTWRWPCCGMSGGTLAILTGARHDPRGYDVRLEAFGTSDSIAVGLDARMPLRSLEAGRGAGGAGLSRLHGSLRAGLPHRARHVRRYRPQSRRVRVLARRGARGNADRGSGRPLARRATSHPDREDRAHLSRFRLRPDRNPTKETGTQWASKRERTRRRRRTGQGSRAAV